jgi:hypothetical protein
MICQEIKCKDLDADGEPAWCCWAGCPAKAAVAKCPAAAGQKQAMPEAKGKPKKYGTNAL